jgi:hypothetical protein
MTANTTGYRVSLDRNGSDVNMQGCTLSLLVSVLPTALSLPLRSGLGNPTDAWVWLWNGGARILLSCRQWCLHWMRRITIPVQMTGTLDGHVNWTPANLFFPLCIRNSLKWSWYKDWRTRWRCYHKHISSLVAIAVPARSRRIRTEMEVIQQTRLEHPLDQVPTGLCDSPERVCVAVYRCRLLSLEPVVAWLNDSKERVFASSVLSQQIFLDFKPWVPTTATAVHVRHPIMRWTLELWHGKKRHPSLQRRAATVVRKLGLLSSRLSGTGLWGVIPSLLLCFVVVSTLNGLIHREVMNESNCVAILELIPCWIESFDYFSVLIWFNAQPNKPGWMNNLCWLSPLYGEFCAVTIWIQ